MGMGMGMGAVVFALLLGPLVFAAPAAAGERALIERMQAEVAGLPLADRLERLSARFVGRDYVLDPFGEGLGARYDADPLHRFDAFDCTTYVETMMALALARDFDGFEETLRRIRYEGGDVSFVRRNHFPSLDWIPNNVAAGFLRDDTAGIAAAGGFAPRVASATIDKRSWYAHLQLAAVNVPGLSEAERRSRLDALRSEGARFEPRIATLEYLHLDDLFAGGQANTGAFDRIPSGTVLNIVRPNWEPSPDYGTRVNVSHQGLVVRVGGVVTLRHATTSAGRVVDAALVEYLRRYLDHATVKGISLLEIRGE